MINVEEQAKTILNLSQEFLTVLETRCELLPEDRTEWRKDLIALVGMYLNKDTFCTTTESISILKECWNDSALQSSSVLPNSNKTNPIGTFVPKWDGACTNLFNHYERLTPNVQKLSDNLYKKNQNGEFNNISEKIATAFKAYIEHRFGHSNFEHFNHSKYFFDKDFNPKETPQLMLRPEYKQENIKTFIAFAHDFYDRYKDSIEKIIEQQHKEYLRNHPEVNAPIEKLEKPLAHELVKTIFDNAEQTRMVLELTFTETLANAKDYVEQAQQAQFGDVKNVVEKYRTKQQRRQEFEQQERNTDSNNTEPHDIKQQAIVTSVNVDVEHPTKPALPVSQKRHVKKL